MRKTISPILMFLLTLLGGVTAWANFSETWTASPVGPWSQSSDLPNGITASGTPYAYSQAVFNRTANANITVTFALTEGSQNLKVLGVHLVSADGQTTYTDYESKEVSNGTSQSYSLTGVAIGNYNLVYYVDNVTSTSEVASTSGNITVTGLEQGKFISSVSELSNDKVYVIKSGRTTESATHYLLYHTAARENLSSTYSDQGHALEYNKAKTNFHFAIQKAGEKYYFYNMAAGKFVGNNSTNNGAIPLVIYPTTDMEIRYNNNDEAYTEYCFLLSTNRTGALNCAATSGCHGVVNWRDGYNTTNDGGNRYQIIEIGDLPGSDKTTIQTKINWGINYNTANKEYSQASNTVVGAYPTASCEVLGNAITTFRDEPTQENNNAMKSAYDNLITSGTRVALSAGKQFTIKCIEDSRGYIVYSTVDGKGSETTAYLASATGWSSFPALNETGVNKAWAIYENNSTKYLYNVAKQRFIKPVTPVAFTDELYAVTLNQVEGEPTQWTIKFPSNNKYLSSSPGWGASAVRAESSVDNGCKFIIELTGEDVTTDVATVMKTLVYKNDLRVALDVPNLIGSGVGHYTYNGEETTETVKQTISTANSLLTSESATPSEIQSSITALNEITASSAINQPEVGKLYRFKCVANRNGKRLTSKLNTSNHMLMDDANGNLQESIFYLNEGNKLLSYATGLYIGDFTQTTPKMHLFAAGSAGVAASFADIYSSYGKNPGAYSIQINNRYIYGKNDVLDSGTNRSNDEGYFWTIEEVEWLPISVTNGYSKLGTFVSPVALEKDEGRLKFYTGKIDGDYFKLEKFTGNVIPANVPFLIEYTGGQYDNDCAYLRVSSTKATFSGENDLCGGLETVEKPSIVGSTIYTLQKTGSDPDTDKQEFRKYTGTTVKGFRAYLPVPNDAQIRGMIFGGQTTDIESATTETAAPVIYDLSGRRVQHAAKGMYIVNGKKMYVK